MLFLNHNTHNLNGCIAFGVSFMLMGAPMHERSRRSPESQSLLGWNLMNLQPKIGYQISKTLGSLSLTMPTTQEFLSKGTFLGVRWAIYL